jgi:hypothetical protein
VSPCRSFQSSPFFPLLPLPSPFRRDSCSTRSTSPTPGLCAVGSSKVTPPLHLSRFPPVFTILPPSSGLATYNILQNPRYKEAFNISDGFALSHGRVKSLRNFGVCFRPAPDWSAELILLQRISFEGMAELESHERGLLEDATTLASPEIRSVSHTTRHIN